MVVQRIFLAVFLIPFGCMLEAQESNGKLLVVFYNVENLFDTRDDPHTLDNEFTKSGDRYWANSRYYKKINHLYKTIVAAGDWDPPDLIGLCEIENKKVLNDLVMNTPLSKYQYDVIHFDSRDERGIDVALLVRDRLFNTLSRSVIRPDPASDSRMTTRDILYVKGVVGDDTLHVLVNHWPSRRSGISETEPLRKKMAELVIHGVDSIRALNGESKILIMGDFNDEMHNVSLKEILKVSFIQEVTDGTGLYSFPLNGQRVPGTYKFRGVWYHFDHFFFTGTLLKETGTLSIDRSTYRIMAPDFLMMEDELYLGVKPFPTFYGFQYLGGFSDHLPILIELKTR